MKHKRGHDGSSGGESSEDERIFQPEQYTVEGEGAEVEEDDFFENSQQDMTQLVPRRTMKIKEEPVSPKKKKKDKREESFIVPGSGRRMNGCRIREVEISEIPEHVIASMKRALPKESDCTDGLTAEDVDTASSSEKGGIWILQCSKNISLSNVLSGKKLSLDGGRTNFGNDDEDNLALTQYAPTDSLGSNIESRQYEAVTVPNEEYKEGMMLILPDANRFKIVTAPVSGHIVIREAVQELRIPRVEIEKSRPRKLPTGIKERHPVYGADFTSIIQKMEASNQQSPRKKKKSRNQEEFANSWNSIQQNGSHCGESSYLLSDIKQEIPDDDYEEVGSKNKKKKKKNKHSDVEDINHNGTLNGSVDDYEDATYGNGDVEHEKPKKKSKKRKREEMESSSEMDTTQVLLHSNDVVVKKSKKSKHRE